MRNKFSSNSSINGLNYFWAFLNFHRQVWMISRLRYAMDAAVRRSILKTKASVQTAKNWAQNIHFDVCNSKILCRNETPENLFRNEPPAFGYVQKSFTKISFYDMYRL